VLRAYVINTGDGWAAIPGGLVRVAEADGSVVSMQRGGHSKDAWILSDEPVDTFSMLRPRNEPLELRRIPRVVPSSVADNTFWLGRYVERSENIARILRSMIPGVRRADEPEYGSLIRLHGCLNSRHKKIAGGRRRPGNFPALEKEIFSMLTDTKRFDSLPCTLAEVSRIGGNVRERLSADMMLLIGQLRDLMRGEPKTELLDYQSKLTECLELLSAFSGMERENINRGSGWLFMSLGRRLERAICLIRQLREITKPLAPEDWAFLERLLEVADSSMTYRSRYYTTLQPLAVLDVMMADETNPRSLDFQLAHIADLYEKLPKYVPEDLESMQNAIISLRSINLHLMSYPPGAKAGASGQSLPALDAFLRELGNLLPSWSNDLSSRYFSHSRTQPINVGE
jgi:uncharacterized alpha-E superfamily protein